MADLTTLGITVCLLAGANIFIGDHKWAPYLAGPLYVIAAVYLLGASGLPYLEHGMVTGPANLVLLWIASPMGRVVNMLAIIDQVHQSMIWTGACLIVAQAAYLGISIRVQRAKRSLGTLTRKDK